MGATLFQTRMPGLKHPTHELSAADRIRRVQACVSSALLLEALDDPTLQTTVRTAIERRLRALERGDG